MSMTFTKLFSSITESTVWCEPDRVRLVWITMLAMADSRGRIWASVPGLANRARVPLEDAEDAIQRFLGPDKYSRTPDHDGRRIEVIDGGWRLLNHEKYRAIRDVEAVKESKRRYINARRQAERSVEIVELVDLQSNAVDTLQKQKQIQRKEEVGSVAPAAQPDPTPKLLTGEDSDAEIPARMLVALAASWSLPQEWGEDAERLGWRGALIVKEAERYRQYWTAGKGAGKRRTVKGWRQSWSNWLAKAERMAA